MAEKYKYYDGFVVEGGKEVTATEAGKLAQHARAALGASGQIERIELYDGGTVVNVDYQVDADVRDWHVKSYPGVPYTVRRRPPEVAGDYQWERVETYSAAGELTGFAAILQGKDHREWMAVDMGVDRKVTGVEKFFWETPEVLRYVFEYDERGKLYSVHDVVNSDSASFDEVKSELKDPQFFENGLKLPRGVPSW